MTSIDRTQLQTMIDENVVTVVEVLNSENFNRFHLPGAINVPLGKSFETDFRRVVPDKSQPVVLYCIDGDCDASSRAAERVKSLGYRRVYEYEDGKVDWRNAGLPVEI